MKRTPRTKKKRRARTTVAMKAAERRTSGGHPSAGDVHHVPAGKRQLAKDTARRIVNDLFEEMLRRRVIASLKLLNILRPSSRKTYIELDRQSFELIGLFDPA